MVFDAQVAPDSRCVHPVGTPGDEGEIWLLPSLSR